MKPSIMRSTSSLTFVTAVLLQCTSHAVADSVLQLATRASSSYGTTVYEGCFSSSSGLEFNASLTYNSQLSCQEQCAPAGYTVEATTNSGDCWCGNSLPPSSSKASDSYCNDPCFGYKQEMCGAADSKYFSVYYTGISGDGSSSTTSTAGTGSAGSAGSTGSTGGASSTSSSNPSVVTVEGQTVVVTATGKAAAKSGGPSKAGIAAGAVVGVVAISAIAGGIFLFIRNGRRRQVEEEYRRNAAISSFISTGKSPTSSGVASLSDTRLEPVLANRRMSDGSIADNHDYSRRILKVTNA